jgi:Ca2+-binding EF-hand superfamily protein
VDFEELKEGLRKLRLEIAHRDLINIFAIFDRDKSNSISLSELRSVLSEFELKLQGKFTEDMD